MTLITDPVCSPTAELRAMVDLSDAWWASLKASLDRLSDWPTSRVYWDQFAVKRSLRADFGDAIDPEVDRWTTAHSDLHWANLTQTQCFLLDWEGSGTAPAGFDAATLYCYSLLMPAVARKVREVFSSDLDSRDGIRAQLCTVTRLTGRIAKGEFADLAPPLHRHARSLIEAESKRIEGRIHKVAR